MMDLLETVVKPLFARIASRLETSGTAKQKSKRHNEMHTNRHAAYSGERRRLKVEHGLHGLGNVALGGEHEGQEVRRGALGVEDQALRVGPAVPGVEHGLPEVENSPLGGEHGKLGVENQRLEVERGKLEVENQPPKPGGEVVDPAEPGREDKSLKNQVVGLLRD